MMTHVMLSRNIVVGIIAVLAVGTALLAVASGDDHPGARKKESTLCEGLQANDARTRDQAVEILLEARKKTVQELIDMVVQSDGKKHSDETRAAAAYLLGMMRAEAAVPALSKALVNPPLLRMYSSDISPYDAPIFTALVRIGRPAVPAMIANIEQTDDENLRLRSLNVLYHVLGGKQHLLELLGKLEARAKHKEVAKRVKAATTFTQEHYKETGKPPLY